jgi:hypothetical protein
MAVIVTSDNPRKLLSEMKSAIRDGKIQSWVVDKDGDFTLQQEQWKDRAWLHPVVTEGKVTFNILSPSLSHLGFRWPHNVLGRRKRSHVRTLENEVKIPEKHFNKTTVINSIRWA